MFSTKLKYVRYLFSPSSILKTFYFNLTYFPLSTALKLPVFVSGNVYLKKMQGKIVFKCGVRTGVVKIGFGDIGIFDRKFGRAIWNISGEVVFNGPAFIGHGNKINVHKGGLLDFGADVIINAESSIVCRKSVIFGKNCLVSWDCMIMDTDFHKIYQEGEQINADKPVLIGDHVWIGMKCCLLKGSCLPEGSIVAAGAIITKSFSKKHCIYGGNPAKVIKENVKWTL